MIVLYMILKVPGQPASNKFQYGYQQFQGGRELGMGPMNRGRGGPGPGPGPGKYNYIAYKLQVSKNS
jgi:hypothetical protein